MGSDLMARVRTAGTAPELMIRRMLSVRRVRYRLNYRALPGKPDLYIPRLRLAVFIHGCFWHGHHCPRGRLPKTNRTFWSNKQAINEARDRLVAKQLEERDVAVIVLWACEHRHFEHLLDRIAQAYNRTPSMRSRSRNTRQSS